MKVNKTENIKEYMKEYNVDYYLKNHIKLLENANRIVECKICKINTSYSNLNKHYKSQKHIQNKKINDLLIRENPIIVN